MGCLLSILLFLRLGFSFLFCEPPLFMLFFSFSFFDRVALFINPSLLPFLSSFHLLCSSPDGPYRNHTEPPAFSRNPPPKPRRNPSYGNPSSSRNPPRDPSVPSSRAQRHAPSQPNQPRPTPPQTSAIVRPALDYKLLYPWAPPALLNETSSINTEADILRLRDKMMDIQ